MTINKQLKSRILSFVWRAFGMILGGGLTYLLQNIEQLDLPSTFTVFGYTAQTYVIAGLVIGEITKYINNTRKKS